MAGRKTQRLEWLRRFGDHVGAISPARFLDERSVPLYRLLMVILLVEAICFLLLGLSVSIKFLLNAFFLFGWMIFAAFIARRYGYPRIALILEAFALPSMCGILIAVASFLTTIISLPMADDLLAAADKAIGFDWTAMFRLYQDHPWLIEPSRLAYNSMALQVGIVPLLLVLVDKSERAWQFLTALTIAGIVTVIVHPFFPAAGPFLQYDVTLEDLPQLNFTYPWTTGETIERIRLGKITDVTSAMNGLVSMPSFHAIAAVTLAWGTYPIRWVGIPLVLLNIGMWMSTIVIGSHYLIDLILGTVVAMMAILVAKHIVSRTNFAPTSKARLDSHSR